MANNQEMPNKLDDGALFWGFLVGFVASGIALLLRVPQRGLLMRWRDEGAPAALRDSGQVLRSRIEAVTTDPVERSITEGKAAARSRRSRLLGEPASKTD